MTLHEAIMLYNGRIKNLAIEVKNYDASSNLFKVLYKGVALRDNWNDIIVEHGDKPVQYFDHITIQNVPMMVIGVD